MGRIGAGGADHHLDGHGVVAVLVLGVDGDGVAEIGIKICEVDCQNRGLGRIILSMLIRYLFDNGFEKIVLDTNLNNLRAQHVYEMLGFRKVRTNIDSWTDQLGRKQSSVDYELVERDFVDYSSMNGSLCWRYYGN